MPKSSITEKNLNRTVFGVIQAVTEAAPETTKNPAAVSRVKLGGVKGEKARALALTARKRKR